MADMVVRFRPHIRGGSVVVSKIATPEGSPHRKPLELMPVGMVVLMPLADWLVFSKRLVLFRLL